MDFIEKAKQFYINEIKDYKLYMYLSEKVKDPYLKGQLQRIAKIEQGHSNFWRNFLEKNNANIPDVSDKSIRKTVASILNKISNPVIVVSFLELGESGGVKEYYQFLKSAPLTEEEKAGLRKIIIDEIKHETFFAKEAEKLGVSNVRDFVLGMNDGLVEILGAVSGLSAVYINNPIMVAISGSIVGIAGALSMGIGAYISVRSQRQVNQSINEKMEILFDVSPGKAVDELKDHLKDLNLPEEIIKDISEKIKDTKALAKLLIKDTDENEIKSGLFTGFAYLIGVLFPVLPYFFSTTSIVALPFSFLFAGIALASVGFIVSVLSGISIKKKIMEMLIAGFSAAGLSYAFGKIIQSVFGIDI